MIEHYGIVDPCSQPHLVEQGLLAVVVVGY